ncbi:MAG: hypothetical protein EPN93_01495 [Spirochaetes bacterium]|nr:MAG: hypothetical protein EPN93_01495 [Spirochaetota bacterium]
MSIKPIDMQSNVGQMHEVARTTHVRAEALVEQQHVLDKESVDKGNLVNSRLEENKKAEKGIIMREERNQKRGEGHGDRGEGKGHGSPDEKAPPLEDEKLGRIVDIKK